MAYLEGPLVKYNRAGEHVETLKRYLSPLQDLKSYVISSDVDNETGQQIRRFDHVPPMPDGVDVIIGEILYNFRCSLDHLIWQLVLSEGQIPNNRNEFPIFNDPVDYEAKKRSKLRGVSTAVVGIVDKFQPCYSTGQNAFWWHLWYLHVLNNADKHRHLLLTRSTLGSVLRVLALQGSTPRGRYLNVPVEEGAIFFRGKFEMDVQIEPRINVVFSNAPSDVRIDLPVLNIADLIHLGVDAVFRELQSHIK